MTEKRIVKVIYTDDTFDEVVNPKPFEIREGEKHWEAFRRYERQFRDLEKSVLSSIDNDIVEDYAKDYFDLIDPDDCECDCDHNDTIEDIDDDIVIREAFCRMVGNDFNDIISQDLMKRFVQVLYASDKPKIEEYIKQKEIELKL